MRIDNQVEMLVPMRVATCLRKRIAKGVMMRVGKQMVKESRIGKPK